MSYPGLRMGAKGALIRQNGGVPPTQQEAAGGLLCLPNPVNLGNTQRMQQAVLQLANSMRPSNTKQAMDVRIQEYFEYVDHVTAPNNPYKYTVRKSCNFYGITRQFNYQLYLDCEL